MKQDVVKSMLSAHDEWMASFIIHTQEHREPSVQMSLFSKQVQDMLPLNPDSPISWQNEAQASALQLASVRNDSNPPLFQIIKSADQKNQWIQLISEKHENFFVVHTLSEKVLPEFLEHNEKTISAIFFPHFKKKFLFSEFFQKQKIETSEIVNLLEKHKSVESGFCDQSFAVAKKSFVVIWKHSPYLKATFLRFLPPNQLQLFENAKPPSVLIDCLITVLWTAATGLGLWWAHSKKLWRLSLKDSPIQNAAMIKTGRPASSEIPQNPQFQQPSVPTEVDLEREFCLHLLRSAGPIGLIALAGNARALVEATPSAHYKGSWWIIQNIDDNRILVAAGDASGEGLSAGTTAYSVRHFIEVMVKRECQSRSTESFLSLIYDLCSNASEGILLGEAHVSLFTAILELEEQKLCFLNAGFPAANLHLGGSKNICLSSYFDPIGLHVGGQPLPRWVNLSATTELVLCNIGARNTDLTELDHSELVKIYVDPFGKHDRFRLTAAADDTEVA